LLESYIDGLNSRRPALFNIYAVCPPEHGVGDDRAVAQSKLAVESRAYPLFRYDPDAGVTFSECVSLDGNPAPDADWPTYSLAYTDENGAKARLELPVTFADFAATEARFSKHFRKAPPETWNDSMLPLAELLELAPDERAGRFPYIWATDPKGRLIRLVVAEELVRASEERLHFWRQLKDVVAKPTADESVVAEYVRADLIQRVVASLGGVGSSLPPAPAPSIPTAPTQSPKQDYEPCWIDSPECSACDECTNLAPGAFAYNPQRQAIVVNPKGAKYADIVKCAEKCTAGCLHPGTPWNPDEPGLDKLRARAAKYN
jgi:pyruvate-ferredoxin/flavodoxin oxidoreductase